MTDQPTATSEQPMTQEQVADPRAAADAAPTDGRPLSTRDLRDAQATPALSPTEQRPGIQAEGQAATDIDAPLFTSDAAGQLRERWIAIQTEFVDSPRDAVEKADSLVAETLKQLTETFARERDALEAGWSKRQSPETAGERDRTGTGAGAEEPSTEELRQAIRRYRSFFNRLLSV